MAFQGFKIDASVESEGRAARVYVQPGYYQVEIAGVRPSPENHEGFPYLLFGYRIKKGAEGIGRQLTTTCTMKEEAQFGLGNILYYIGKKELQAKLVGKDIPTYAKFKEFTAKVEQLTKGGVLTVLVADGNYNGKPTSDVQETYAGDYYDEVAGEAEEDEEDEPVVMPIAEDEEEEEVPAPKKGRGRPAKAAAPAPAKAPKATAPTKAVAAVDDDLDAFFDD